jgi:hypothetical protein
MHHNAYNTMDIVVGDQRQLKLAINTISDHWIVPIRVAQRSTSCKFLPMLGTFHSSQNKMSQKQVIVLKVEFI